MADQDFHREPGIRFPGNRRIYPGITPKLIRVQKAVHRLRLAHVVIRKHNALYAKRQQRMHPSLLSLMPIRRAGRRLPARYITTAETNHPVHTGSQKRFCSLLTPVSSCWCEPYHKVVR